MVRFYFQDDRNKVVTKCIRVSSKTTVAMLMDTLVEKFNPDMKMLTHSNYELFECHEKGGEWIGIALSAIKLLCLLKMHQLFHFKLEHSVMKFCTLHYSKWRTVISTLSL